MTVSSVDLFFLLIPDSSHSLHDTAAAAHRHSAGLGFWIRLGGVDFFAALLLACVHWLSACIDFTAVVDCPSVYDGMGCSGREYPNHRLRFFRRYPDCSCEWHGCFC